MTNSINWFEIPAENFERAKTFYGSIFNATIQDMPVLQMKYATLPYNQQGGVGGAIASGEGFVPSAKGVVIYLNGGDDLSIPLGKVEKAGGKIILPKTEIGGNMGYMALFIDTEGNKVGLHSMG